MKNMLPLIFSVHAVLATATATADPLTCVSNTPLSAYLSGGIFEGGCILGDKRFDNFSGTLPTTINGQVVELSWLANSVAGVDFYSLELAFDHGNGSGVYTLAQGTTYFAYDVTILDPTRYFREALLDSTVVFSGTGATLVTKDVIPNTGSAATLIGANGANVSYAFSTGRPTSIHVRDTLSAFKSAYIKNVSNTFVQQEVPELDKAAGSGALGLILGAMGLVERRRRK